MSSSLGNGQTSPNCTDWTVCRWASTLYDGQQSVVNRRQKRGKRCRTDQNCTECTKGNGPRTVAYRSTTGNSCRSRRPERAITARLSITSGNDQNQSVYGRCTAGVRQVVSVGPGGNNPRFWPVRPELARMYQSTQCTEVYSRSVGGCTAGVRRCAVGVRRLSSH